MTSLSPPSENRVLALETMRITGSRAQAAQRVFAPRDPGEGSTEQGASDGADRVRADTTEIGAGTGSVSVAPVGSIYHRDDPSLPAAALTATNLRHYLTAAMATQPGFMTGERPGGLRARIRRLLGSGRQEEFNAAVLHVLHQLDHRSQAQESRINALEASLRELRRSVAPDPGRAPAEQA